MGKVTIPRAEYEQLVAAKEQLEDIQAYQAWLSNPGPSFPADIVEKIIDGEHPLAVMRQWRGLSQQELAVRADVSRVQIGGIETRGATGSVETLKKLANALDLTIDDIVPA